jgi:tetratricopeptide (TPR) repeat protein/transcriptional regulator with XRE-family HTH domain
VAAKIRGLHAMKAASSARGITLDRQKLRELRRQRSMTQAALAIAADVSDDTVSRAERRLSISLENAMAIAGALNVDVASLTTEDHEPEPAAADAGQVFAASNIPIRVPAHFMGREAALADIETAMRRYHGRVAITALHGLRGVGKTVLAAAYAERHRGDYRATWWLRAETEAGMRADLVGLGVRLGWVGADDKEEPALAAVSERLGYEGDGILLIFDNAVDPDSLAPYLPRGGAARVLVTSNYHAWRGTAAPVEIRLWPKEIGADYLIARTGRDSERQAAEDLSVALGGLPLAHEQAAAYCERLDLSLAEYARRFAAEPARLLDTDKDAPANYHDKLTVAKTFALAIEEAAQLHQAAGPLIVLCALLAPEPIPLFLFAEGREKFGEPFSSLLAGDGLDEAVAALRAFALIDRETIADERDPTITTDTIRLHRLVREVAATRRIGAARDDARRALIEAMASVYPPNVYDDPATWPQARWLDLLAWELVGGGAAPPRGAEMPACELMTRLAPFLQLALADYERARPLYEHAIKISEQVSGPEHPETAARLNYFGPLLRVTGDKDAARLLHERALKICMKELGPDHRDTATSQNHLGRVYQELGRPRLALPLLRHALVVRKKVYAESIEAEKQSVGQNLAGTHLNLANTYKDLGRITGDQGHTTRARLYYGQALAIFEKLPRQCSATVLCMQNFASFHEEQGDPDKALALLKRALKICEDILPRPKHPTTIAVQESIAVLTAQGA